MSTQASPEPIDADGAERGRGFWREHRRSLLLIALAGAVVGAFYLGIYVVHRYPMPIGWDTPRYLGQTSFVAERGLGGVPDQLPPPNRTLDSRAAGFPVVTLLLSALLRTPIVRMAPAVPIVAGAAAALAAGALVTFALRRPPWQGAVVALVVGFSPMLVRLMAPETYADNLLAAALGLAGLVALVGVLRGEGGWTAAIVLFGLTGLAHPTIALLLFAILGLIGLAYLPASIRRWRTRASSIWTTPTVRIAVVGIAAAVLAAIGVVVVLGAGLDGPFLTRGELVKKLTEDVPLYLFPVTAPLAALGLWSLFETARRRRAPSEAGDGVRHTDGPAPAPMEPVVGEAGGARFLLWLSLAWGLVAVVGVGLFFLGRLSPAHRFLAFLLPVPVLVALGIMWIGAWFGRRSASGPGIGRAVVGLGVAGAVVLGAWGYYVTIPGNRGVEWLEIHKVEDAGTALAYLDAAGVPKDGPVVYVIDDRGQNPLSYVPEMAYILRSTLPPTRIEHAYFYVGEPDRFLDGKATYRKIPHTYNLNMRRFWPTIRDLLPEQPTALLVEAYNPAFGEVAAEHPDWVVGPGVIALGGGVPVGTIGPPAVPTGVASVARTILAVVGGALVIAATGLGWAVVLLPRRRRPFEVLALSPAMGLGALMLAGVVVDSVGIRLVGLGGVGALLLAAVPGWIVAVRRHPAQATVEPSLVPGGPMASMAVAPEAEAVVDDPVGTGETGAGGSQR
jgi:hypothetical protein